MLEDGFEGEMLDKVKKMSGVGEFVVEGLMDKEKKIGLKYLVGEKVFLVERKNTIEVRTDEKLRDLLVESYESVMESRYFGKGGVEVVLSGQIVEDEILDLVRLSYNLSK